MTAKLKQAAPSAITGRQIRGNVAFFIRFALATNTPVRRVSDSVKNVHGSKPAQRKTL